VASAIKVVTVLLVASACGKPSPNASTLGTQPAPEIEGRAVKAGSDFQLSHQRGKVVMLAFGYTSCSSICPLTLNTMGGVYRALGPAANALEALYVSVDPGRDTPDRMRSFLGDFDSRIEGLVLQPPALSSVLEAYGVATEKRPPEVKRYVGRPVDPSKDYAIQHSASVWLVDPSGRLRLRYGSEATAAEIAKGVRQLLPGAS